MPPARSLLAGLVVGLVLALGAGCTGPGAVPTSRPVGTSAPARVGALVEVPGPGWSASGGLVGRVPVPGACRVGRSADGRPLPDPRCTPGAIDTDVTQESLSATICRPGGYTSSVRPPERLTEPFKIADLAAYGEGGAPSGYELDHLVPLELGGASASTNLWPEPDDHPPGAANSKDPVEATLHSMVCAEVSGAPYLPLRTAQVLIATDWTTAVSRAQGFLVRPAGSRAT